MILENDVLEVEVAAVVVKVVIAVVVDVILLVVDVVVVVVDVVVDVVVMEVVVVSWLFGEVDGAFVDDGISVEMIHQYIIIKFNCSIPKEL